MCKLAYEPFRSRRLEKSSSTFLTPYLMPACRSWCPSAIVRPKADCTACSACSRPPDFRDLMLFLILIPAPFIWLFERSHHENMVRFDTLLGAMAKTLWWTSTRLAGQARDTPGTV